MFNQQLFDAELERLRQMFPECYIDAFTPQEYKIADRTVTGTDAKQIAEYIYNHASTSHIWKIIYDGIAYARGEKGLYD
jgi:hypothetical protein